MSSLLMLGASLPEPLIAGPPGAVPELPLTPLAEWINTISGMAIKPGYMILALVIYRFLRRASELDLRLLRASMLAFFAGEGFCALNFVPVIGNRWYIDFAHGFGMVAFGAWLAWGLFELLDRRVIRFASPDERCVLQRFCGHCWKRDQVRCGLQRLFQLLAPALALCALIPLTGPLRPLRFTMDVLGTEIITEYYWPLLLIEFRIYPIAAFVLLLVAGLLLLGGPRSVQLAKRPFFWGLGLMSYSLIRFLLFSAFYPDPTWANLWEELTELIAILSAGMLVWVFREQLGLPRPRPDRAAPAAAR